MLFKDSEVDFILYGPRGLHAFEIKRSSHVHKKDLSGLKTFGEDYPEAKLHLIFLGTQREYYDTIDAIPLEIFLRTLPEIIS